MTAVAGMSAAMRSAAAREMRPSPIRCEAARISSRRARLAREEIVTEMNSLPSVVGPAVSIRIRSDASPISVK